MVAIARSVVLLMLLTGLLFVAGSLPANAKPFNQIAFVRDGDVWIMNADGSGQTVVERAPDGSEYRNPEWLPNGRSLWFGEVDTRFGAYVPDGPFRTVIRNLVSGGKSFLKASNAQWSPDGHFVSLYSRYSTDVAQLASADLKHTWRLSNPQGVSQTIWLNRHKLLLLSGDSKLIEIYNFDGLEKKPTATVIEPQQEIRLPGIASIESLALSPSRERVAVTVKLDENNYRLDIYRAVDFEFEKSVLTGKNDPDLVNHYVWGTMKWAGDHGVILVDSSNYNYTINGLSILNIETKEHLGGPEGGQGMQIGNPSVSPSGGEVAFDRGDPSVYAEGTPAVYVAVNKRGKDLREQRKVADNASEPAWQPIPKGTTPVLLIHGMGNSADNWSEWTSDLAKVGEAELKKGAQTMGKAELFQSGGGLFDDRPWAFALNYQTYRSAKGNIMTTAQAIPWAIKKIKEFTGERKVDIVSHSMGGLLARAYMENMLAQPYKGDIDGLITLNTPHMGSSLADNSLLGELISRLPFIGGGDAAQDMDPDSAFIQQANSKDLPSGSKYTFVIGNYYPFFGDGLLAGIEQIPYQQSINRLRSLGGYEIKILPTVHSETINESLYQWGLKVSGVNTAGASGEAVPVLSSNPAKQHVITRLRGDDGSN